MIHFLLIFLLCSEALSTLIIGVVSRNTLIRFKPGKHCPTISHLFFADDSLIFCKASIEQVWTFRSILKLYELASGQVVNVAKSALFFSPNVMHDFWIVLSNLIGMSMVGCLEKYLSVPSSFSKNRRENFRSIKQRAWQTLQGWKGNFFSAGGKKVLIKSVAQAIPTYIMSFFRLPQTLCDDIHRMMGRFWWGSTTAKRKIHWKKWADLCLPKELRGLNFRNLVDF